MFSFDKLNTIPIMFVGTHGTAKTLTAWQVQSVLLHQYPAIRVKLIDGIPRKIKEETGVYHGDIGFQTRCITRYLKELLVSSADITLCTNNCLRYSGYSDVMSEAEIELTQLIAQFEGLSKYVFFFPHDKDHSPEDDGKRLMDVQYQIEVERRILVTLKSMSHQPIFISRGTVEEKVKQVLSKIQPIIHHLVELKS